MKEFFEKHETAVCIGLILLYMTLNSYCQQNFGFTDYRSALINTAISIGLIILMIMLKRTSYYGLTKVKDYKKYLFFIPLLPIMSVNLWCGIEIKNTGSEILFFVLTMINAAFIEEIIIRGFLFRMIEKRSIKRALVVSAVTFGIGHIVNLLNGQDFIPTMLQVCYAMTIGYLFGVIFYKSKSLVPCIITHMILNATSIIGKENDAMIYIDCVILLIVSMVYAVYLNKKVIS